MAGLFLFANSCHDDEISSNADLALKSGVIKDKVTIADVKSWFEANPEQNSFELLKWNEEIKWSKALVIDFIDSIAVEVPVKLKGKYKVMDENDSNMNFEHRLLFMMKKNAITPYMEYFISKKDLGFLQDTENVNYSKKAENFAGTIVLENSKKEIEVVYHSESEDNCQEMKLKSATPDVTCYGMFEIFSDGSRTLLYIIGCTYSGGTTGTTGSVGSSGGGISPTTQPCSCTKICPICQKCLDNVMLKSAPKPGGGGTTTTTVNCEMCAGHPLPVPAPVPAPDHPIISIQEYLKCINSSSPATITIYVDQPVAGSSKPNFGLNVGHAFIGISQGSNTSIFGFYPKSWAIPGSSTAESILGDDSSHGIDVSVSINVSPSQLAGILYYANNHSGTYDLNNNNCTDFAISIGNMAGMNLPDTPGTWPGGGGSNPGALGQDIRYMNLSSGMNRNTSGGSAPSNVKNCNQ